MARDAKYHRSSITGRYLVKLLTTGMVLLRQVRGRCLRLPCNANSQCDSRRGHGECVHAAGKTTEEQGRQSSFALLLPQTHRTLPRGLHELPSASLQYTKALRTAIPYMCVMFNTHLSKKLRVVLWGREPIKRPIAKQRTLPRPSTHLCPKDMSAATCTSW
jgi:hypothetical protein